MRIDDYSLDEAAYAADALTHAGGWTSQDEAACSGNRRHPLPAADRLAPGREEALAPTAPNPPAVDRG